MNLILTHTLFRIWWMILIKKAPIVNQFILYRPWLQAMNGEVCTFSFNENVAAKMEIPLPFLQRQDDVSIEIIQICGAVISLLLAILFIFLPGSKSHKVQHDVFLLGSMIWIDGLQDIVCCNDRAGCCFTDLFFSYNIDIQIPISWLKVFPCVLLLMSFLHLWASHLRNGWLYSYHDIVRFKLQSLS